MSLPNKNYALDDPFPRAQFPQSLAGAYYAATGLAPAYYFAGNALEEQILGILLTENGSATFDAYVADTLPDWPSDGAGPMWNHAFGILAANDSLTVPTATSIDLGFGSFVVHLTGKVTLPVSGAVDLWGNRLSPNGIEIQVNDAGDLLVSWNAGGTLSAKIDAVAVTGVWFECVIRCVRVPGQPGTMEIASTRAQMLSAGVVPADDDFNNASLFAIGKGPSGIAPVGQCMRVVISTGAQCNATPAQFLAQEGGAKGIWWDPMFTTVEEDAR